MTHQQIESRLRKFAHANDADDYFDVSISTDTHEIQIEHIFLITQRWRVQIGGEWN